MLIQQSKIITMNAKKKLQEFSSSSVVLSALNCDTNTVISLTFFLVKLLLDYIKK